MFKSFKQNQSSVYSSAQTMISENGSPKWGPVCVYGCSPVCCSSTETLCPGCNVKVH